MGDDLLANDNLFSHPTEAQPEAKTEDTSAVPVAMPVFSHPDR